MIEIKPSVVRLRVERPGHAPVQQDVLTIAPQLLVEKWLRELPAHADMKATSEVRRAAGGHDGVSLMDVMAKFNVMPEGLR